MIRIDKRVTTAATYIGSIVAALLLTWISVAGKNNYILPALGGVLMLVVCFLSVKTALIILVMSMLLSPEIGVGSTTKREITIRFDDLLLLVITAAWFLRMAVLKDIGFMRKNPLNRPIIAFCLLAALSTVFGIYRGDVNLLSGAFFVLKLVEYFFLFYMVINYVETKEDIYLFMRMLLAVCAIVCAYALFQAATGGDVAAPFEGSRGERNTLGGYLVLIASVTGGMLFYRDRGKGGRNLVILLTAITITLLFSLSRSGWSGLLVSFAALFIVARRFRLFVVILLLLVPLTPLLIPEKARERFEYTFTESYAAHRRQVKVLGIQLDGSSSARLRSYGLVLREVPKHLFFGYGITGFAFIDGQFFRLLSETGIIGLGVFIWLLASVYRLILRAKALAIPDSLRGMIIGFQAAFWGVMMHALTANTFIIIRIAEPFWFFTGLITVVSLIYNNDEPLRIERPSATGIAHADTAPAGAS
ncbi:MAG: O-antigen ligase family protein [Chitinispirillaceae bacterium]|nr:O-antigen ligase family protein [Chitinispirillaceae bacterium]